MPLTTAQIVDSIDARLAALGRERSTLERARQALGGAPNPVRAEGATNRAGGGARRRRVTRPGRAVVSGQLEKLLAENGGSTTPTLAKLASARSDQVLRLLRTLEAAGKARRTGARRGTRWHAVTDEDRIAARAAELAAR